MDIRRRPLCGLLSAVLFVVTSAGPAFAQDGADDSSVADSTVPCRGWGSLIPPPAGSRIPVCAMEGLTHPDLIQRFPELLLPPQLSDTDQLFHGMPDQLGDQFLLDSGEVSANADPATDIEAAYHTLLVLDRKRARALGRWLTADLPPDAVLTTDRPLARTLRPGDWNWFFFPTAADPLSSPIDPRVFQISFLGQPGRSVPATIPSTSALDGARHVVHYRQDPAPQGEIRHSIQQSDFAGRPGPDGTRYYNATPGFIVVTTPAGIQFYVPDELGSGGAYRPSAWDGQAWDLVSGPESPMAYLPMSGQAMAGFENALLVLRHEEIADQTFLFEDQPQAGVTLPSFFGHLLWSAIYGQLGAPAPLAVVLDAQDRQLVFEQIQARIAEEPSGPIFEHGLTGFGQYCFDDLAFTGLDGTSWSDGTPLSTADLEAVATVGHEFRRAIGTPCVVVTEEEGVHHAAAWRPWLEGSGPPTFDPELAAAMLELAGWGIGPDGVLTPLTP